MARQRQERVEVLKFNGESDFGLRIDEAFVVTGVELEKAAHRAGIQVGDRLQAFRLTPFAEKARTWQADTLEKMEILPTARAISIDLLLTDRKLDANAKRRQAFAEETMTTLCRNHSARDVFHRELLRYDQEEAAKGGAPEPRARGRRKAVAEPVDAPRRKSNRTATAQSASSTSQQDLQQEPQRQQEWLLAMYGGVVFHQHASEEAAKALKQQVLDGASATENLATEIKSVKRSAQIGNTALQQQLKASEERLAVATQEIEAMKLRAADELTERQLLVQQVAALKEQVAELRQQMESDVQGTRDEVKALKLMVDKEAGRMNYMIESRRQFEAQQAATAQAWGSV